MKKIFAILAAAMTLASCNMDFYRSDTMTSAMLSENPAAAVYTTDGNYALLKDRMEYSNDRSDNIYLKILFQMTEFRGDNTCLSGRTTSPVYSHMTYTDNPQVPHLSYFWYISYKIIYGCTSNIESIDEDVSAEMNHLLGENYFLRAMCHFNLCNLYATPYSRGAEKPGIVIRNSTDCSVTKRATVGETYTQIVSDLEDAMRLMKGGQRRGDAGYASYEAAAGLLTRVYLYMGEYQKCIDLADELLGANPASCLDDITTYFANTRTSKETLFCIVKTESDKDYSPRSELASLYYSPDAIGGTGWCEIYWSDPLIELMFRHPEDKRLTYYGTISATNDGKKMIHWPIPDNANRFRLNANVNNISFDMDASENTITYQGKSYIVKRTTEHTGYPEYYIENLYEGIADDNDGFMGPKQTRVYVRDNVDVATGIRQTFPAYTMSKFSYQNGNPMLASPAVVRMGEVVLNVAEAYAHLQNESKALEYVNIIRTRAGIPTWRDKAHYESEGYDNLLDVVLDERRLELCFEGHRALDLYRNGRAIDRRFAGNQDWEVIELTDDEKGLDFRFPYCIPFEETSVSGIPGNGKNY
jgi:hypothetical protein